MKRILEIDSIKLPAVALDYPIPYYIVNPAERLVSILPPVRSITGLSTDCVGDVNWRTYPYSFWKKK